MDFIKILFSILIPPLGVFLETGVSKTLVINGILTLLGYLPGVIHAAYVIGKK